ncbi:MAG: hypothetical protein ACI8QC_002069 [Planctomycetota bacterium]|jgi:hypothetical protein
MRRLSWVRRMGRPAALVTLLLLGAVNSVQAQTPDERAAGIAKLISQAQTARAVIRPQAARRLINLGEEAGLAILAAAGDTPAEFAALGKDLVEVSGYFDLPPLRAKLWTAISNANFPWRPAAAVGLSAEPTDSELARFDTMLSDPLASVRNAAVIAYGHLGASSRKQDLGAHLKGEEDGRVRRTIAAQLNGWGDHWALWYLVSDLRRTDEFFGQPTGRMSRLAALKLLRKSLGEDFGFKAVDEPNTKVNSAALAAITSAVQAIAGPEPSLAPIARLAPRYPDERLGLELRSCRLGEFFLRWTASDQLLVGRGTPAVVQLEAGTVAGLFAVALESSTALGDQRLWGQPGCDQETFHVLGPGDKRPSVRLISKGPAAVPGLRPAALSSLSAQLLASLPAGPAGDSRLSHLRSRVAACLGAIGGSPD